MKPYSLDLRRRIVDTYTAGGISQHQLADRFCVNLSFVSRLLKRYRTTNSLAPKVRSLTNPWCTPGRRVERISSPVQASRKTSEQVRKMFQQ